MLFTVAIAVCLSGTPVSQCQQPTAVSWIVAPEHPNTIAGCMQHGMLYAAESRLVTEGSYAKVFCSPGGRAGRSTASLQP